MSVTCGLVLLLSACAHGPSPACRLAVVPSAKAGVSGPGTVSQVDTSCEMVPAEELRQLAPPQTQPLSDEDRAAWFTRLNDAASKFYGEDVTGGTAGLLACFEEVQDRPELLPSEPTERTRTYALLLAVFRLEHGREPASGDRVARWLAVHMPEMQPSVRYLPPPLADRALEVARNVGPHVNLVAPQPACEGDWLLFVDGLALLPTEFSPLPPGDHAVWYECGPLRSWVRRIQLTEDLHLDRPEMPLEAGLIPSESTICTRSDLPPELKGKVAVDLARRTGSSGILLLPDKGDALLVTPDGQSRIVPPDQGRYLVDALTLSQKTTSPMAVARWILVPSAAVFLAGGVASNLYYNHQVDRMDQGTLDLRNDADAWRYTAIGGYAAASATFTTAVLLFLLDSGK